MAWLTGWSYAKDISLTGQSGAGTLYQVDLDIGASAGGDFHLENHCTNFPQDIEVTDNNGTTLLDFRIEDITADPIKIWVEVADDLGSNQTIRIYYGKSGATTNSDGDATFPSLFDDFPGSAIDAGKWQEQAAGGSYSVSGSILSVTGGASTGLERIESLSNFAAPTILRIRANLQATDASLEISTFLFNTISGGGLAVNTNQLYSSAGSQGVYAGDGSNYGSSVQTVHGAWHTFEIVRTGTATSFYKDDALLTTINYDISGARYLQFMSRNLQVTQSDWVLLRKYNSPEPAFSSAGAEQSAPSVGAIMNQFQKANMGADLYNGAIIA